MTTWSASVAASADDAVELTGTMSLTGTLLNANSGAQIAGMRFLNCTIPAESTINSATLTINISSTSYDDPDVTISAQLGDAATFTTTASDITNRTKTTATVAWTATGLGTGAENAPDLATVIQEVVNGSWASGYDLAVFITGSASSALRWYSFDNGSNAASISIDYTEPPTGDGQPTVARTRLVPGMGRAHGHQGW